MALNIVIAVLGILAMTKLGQALVGYQEIINSFTNCETIVRKIDREDRATIVDDSPSRLHHTWLSQNCEVRAGPDYIIRKYTFFENGTFLLLRYHYAEESCSIAMYTVVIRGSIQLLGPSTIVSGATDTKFFVDAVNIIPLNQQVAHKFWLKLNLSCSPQPRWRPYASYLIFEYPRQHLITPPWHDTTYNSLHSHLTMKKNLNCLEPFGIEFDELKLLMVQEKPFKLKAFSDTHPHGPRFVLLLGNTAPNADSRWVYKTTSLQSTAMVRADTTYDCPICSSVSRGTEFSPPLLHEMLALPALIGGHWISENCESSEGGNWAKKQFQLHSGDKIWTGRWDYYNDPQCSAFSYAIIVIGKYVKRAGIQGEFDEEIFFKYFHTINTSAKPLFKRNIQEDISDTASKLLKSKKRSARSENIKTKRAKITRNNKGKRSLTDGVYQLLRDVETPMAQSRLMAMLRGHQRQEATTKKSTIWSVPSGTTELDLYIAESMLVTGDATYWPCETNTLLADQPKNCVSRVIEAPTILRLRAKVSINWDGQYILLLGFRDDNVWEAPLRQCAQIPSRNPILREHLRKSVGLLFGLSSTASANKISVWFLFLMQFILCWLYCMLYSYLIR